VGASRSLALASILAAPLATALAADLPFLHVVPVTLRAGVDIDLARPLRVAAASGDGEAVDLRQYQPLDDPWSDAYLRPSFVIDFDQPAMETLQREAATLYGAQPSVPELVRFTRDALDESWDGQLFAVASKAAASRSGDCSEHAVLLAGLARAFERPARVVLGVLVVTHEDQLGAFGHAWAEIHDGARWQRADATDWEGVDTLGHVPVGVLRDEGPGYALDMIASMQSPWFHGIEIVGNADSR
jgi:transglutaminase-like putative cysteine protease